MQYEFNYLIRNNMRGLVHRSCDVNIIRCMWIFRHKMKSNGYFERYKARLVGGGWSQIARVDYDETSSHVVKPTTIRVVLTISFFKLCLIHQLDVHNAFFIWGSS